MGAVVEVEHLQKRYASRVAVEDVSFEVAEGEIFGLLGPNGAGKTTTVECVQGLLPRTCATGSPSSTVGRWSRSTRRRG
jgi:ABC-2 type transport system ATP-binding protein